MTAMNPGPTGVTPDVLVALLRKYRVLAGWRRQKDLAVQTPGDPTDVAAAPAMRALAEEFPGALRELDLLGLEELERRVACLEAAMTDREARHEGDPADGREGEHGREREYGREREHGREGEHGRERDEWIGWIAAYHALMRLALALRSPSPPAAPPPALADETFLRDVLRPPGGRLSRAVLQALARQFHRPAEELRAVLFPPRR